MCVICHLPREPLTPSCPTPIHAKPALFHGTRRLTQNVRALSAWRLWKGVGRAATLHGGGKNRHICGTCCRCSGFGLSHRVDGRTASFNCVYNQPPPHFANSSTNPHPPPTPPHPTTTSVPLPEQTLFCEVHVSGSTHRLL